MAKKPYTITNFDKDKINPLNFMLDEIYQKLENIQKRLAALTDSEGGTSIAHGDLTGVTSDQHHAQLHSATHESGGSDALDGTHGIEAVKIVSGNRFYFKDSAGSNVISGDESGNLWIKGSVHENQASV